MTPLDTATDTLAREAVEGQPSPTELALLDLDKAIDEWKPRKRERVDLDFRRDK